jgi:hypothetical protein
MKNLATLVCVSGLGVDRQDLLFGFPLQKTAKAATAAAAAAAVTQDRNNYGCVKQGQKVSFFLAFIQVSAV